MRSAEMSYEIECPVCDRKAQVSTSVCPYCGADLTMASFDELEEVAQSIATGKRTEPTVHHQADSKSQARAPEPTEVEQSKSGTETNDESKSPIAPTTTGEKELAEIPEETKSAEEGKKEEEGKKGLGRLFGRKKK